MDGKQHDKYLTLRMTRPEWDWVIARAREQNLSVAMYIRSKVWPVEVLGPGHTYNANYTPKAEGVRDDPAR